MNGATTDVDERALNNHKQGMSDTGVRISTLLLQYWYQIRNAVPMLSSIGTPVREEDGPAFLFSTSFSTHLIATEFAHRFALVPWMTYRKDFEPIEGYTTDCGWGCMLRSAQMMLAEALFRRECAQGTSVVPRATREKVFRLFADHPDRPYSIHEMSRRAAHYGKKAGEWFEPTLTLLIVKEMLQERAEIDHLRAIVARDGLLDASSLVPTGAVLGKDDDFDPLLKPRGQVPTSVLILVPLRLGLRELNDEIYGAALIQALKFPQSVGMVGGKPGHSLYFCGSQGRKLVFLDPHTVQSTESCADLRTFQCPDARAMPGKEVDPSLALGFLVSSYEDFMDLKMRVETLPGPSMFSISTKPIDYENEVLDMDDQVDEDEFEQVGLPNSPLQNSSSSLNHSSSSIARVTTPQPAPPMSSSGMEDEDDFTSVSKTEAIKPPSPKPKKDEFVFL